MSSTHVRTALKTHLGGLALAGMPYIETSNLPADATTLPNAWFTAEFTAIDERQVTFGSPGANIYRESGVASVKLMVRPGDTETPLLTHAQAVVDSLRGAVLSDVVVNEVNPPATSPDDSDGAWREAIVNVDYEYDRYI